MGKHSRAVARQHTMMITFCLALCLSLTSALMLAPLPVARGAARASAPVALVPTTELLDAAEFIASVDCDSQSVMNTLLSMGHMCVKSALCVTLVAYVLAMVLCMAQLVPDGVIALGNKPDLLPEAAEHDSPNGLPAVSQQERSPHRTPVVVMLGQDDKWTMDGRS